MKRLMSSLFVVLFSLVLSQSVFAATKKPRIGFILSTMQEERYQKDKRYFEAAVTKAGGEVLFASCNNNPQTQAAEVDNLLSKGIDVLVIQAVNGDTATPFVTQAKKDGVPVVAYDRMIKNADLDAYITENSVKLGELMAEAAVKATGAKGNYVILVGEAGHSVAEARTKGMLNILNKHPGIKVVSKQYHAGWSPNLAMQTIENVLTQNKNDIQAILANNSGMAHGALQALEEQKLTGKVFLAGADADLANIKAMVAGKQQYEVAVPIEEMAGKAAMAAMALAEKKEFKSDSTVENGFKKDGKLVQIKTLNAPVVGIAPSDIESKIVKTGFHSRDAVFGKVASSKK
jgi:D-xylose transport system substrate-binding protein